MVIGTGIDIIEIDRIIRAIRKKSFFEQVFTRSEREYYQKTGCNPQILASTLAAKEAIAKALSVGYSGEQWLDIEILRDDGGQPYVKLYNSAEQRMNDLGGNTINVSISHIKTLAVAQAILEE